MSILNSQNHHNFFQRDTNSQATPQNSPSNGKINPAILFIIIILAVIFFISGLLHLIVKFLLKQRSTISSQSNNNNNNYHDNLQQLFTLHDSGLDQAFIDALPVFLYKEIVQMSVNLASKVMKVDTLEQGSKPVSDIVGLKEPFDCAVCLCEFSECDKLRLLPLCSHAFHIDCIDTWLLSNSTCPLCRGSLYTPGIDVENTVFDFEDLRDDYDGSGNGKSDKPFRFPVRLGKFRSTSNCNDVVKEDSLVVKLSDVGETSSSNLDARRCYSMGSYQYVVDDSILQVALCPNTMTTTTIGGVELKRLNWRNEQSRESITTTAVIANANANVNVDDVEARKINVGSKKESLSVSKIWLWSKKSKFPNSSNADFSGVTVDMSLPWWNRS